MSEVFERNSHRARLTKRGNLSEVRPSAAPRSGSRNHAECARAGGRGERLLSGGVQDFSTDRGFRLAPLSFSRNVARPGALTNSRPRQVSPRVTGLALRGQPSAGAPSTLDFIYYAWVGF